jgi:hypothetical protein
MNDLAIKVLNVTRAVGHGNVRAWAVVKVGDITINDCKVIQQPGQRAYVTGPQKQVGDRWFPLVSMTSSLRQRVQAEVLDAAERAGLVEAPHA